MIEVYFGVMLKGQLEYYIKRGVSLDEYIKIVGLRELIKEKKLEMVLEVFIRNKKERGRVYRKYKKQYFVMKPLNFQKLLPFK